MLASRACLPLTIQIPQRGGYPAARPRGDSFLQRIGADPWVCVYNPPPATRDACPPPPAGDKRTRTGSAINAVPRRPRGPQSPRSPPLSTWPMFSCPESVGSPLPSAPGHAGRVSTPACGGHKNRNQRCLWRAPSFSGRRGHTTPNERMQRLVRFLIHPFCAGDTRARTGEIEMRRTCPPRAGVNRR